MRDRRVSSQIRFAVGAGNLGDSLVRRRLLNVPMRCLESDSDSVSKPGLGVEPLPTVNRQRKDRRRINE